MPSFHTIWALLCVYLLRDWKYPFIVLGLINSLLIIACVLLGWHYLSDVLVGVLLAGGLIYARELFVCNLGRSTGILKK